MENSSSQKLNVYFPPSDYFKRLRLGQGTHQLPTLTSDSQLLSPEPRATDNHLSAVESWVLFLKERQLPSSPQSLVSIRLRLDRTSVCTRRRFRLCQL